MVVRNESNQEGSNIGIACEITLKTIEHIQSTTP
jgi:hypothetical protein